MIWRIEHIHYRLSYGLHITTMVDRGVMWSNGNEINGSFVHATHHHEHGESII